MTFLVGDIVFLNSPTAGHYKYHICLGQNEYQVTLCVFLNSKQRSPTDIIFDCSAFPEIPPSETGTSVVSLSMVPRFKEEQFELYDARKIGVISLNVARAILEKCPSARVLTTIERAFIASHLSEFIATQTPPS